jgi:hypothetical protein
LRDRIKQIFGGGTFDFVPFASGPYEVPDDIAEGKPRLVLISHDALEIGATLDEIPDLAKRIYERKGADGQGIRSLRNNLIFVLADSAQVVLSPKPGLEGIVSKRMDVPNRCVLPR